MGRLLSIPTSLIAERSMCRRRVSPQRSPRESAAAGESRLERPIVGEHAVRVCERRRSRVGPSHLDAAAGRLARLLQQSALRMLDRPW
jgi:hypothetical protein